MDASSKTPAGGQSGTGSPPADAGAAPGSRLRVGGIVVAAFALIIVAFLGYEFFAGHHRPDPFAADVSAKSWAWWRHPLPEQSLATMPRPIGRFGKFIERGDYRTSHLTAFAPGEATAALDGIGAVEIADFAPFADGSAWAVDTDGGIYSRAAEGRWTTRQVDVVTFDERQEAPIFGSAQIAAPETNAPVTSAVFTPDGEGLVAATEEGRVLFWSISRGDWSWAFDIERDLIQPPAFARKNPWLLLASQRIVIVVDWSSGKVVTELPAGKGLYSAAAFAPDDSVWTWDQAFALQRWAPDSGRQILRIDLFGIGDVEQIKFGPGGRRVALGTRNSVTLVDRESGKIIWQTRERQELREIAFTRDGEGLVAYGESVALYLDIDSGKVISAWNGMRVLQFAANVDQVLGQSYEGELVAWLFREGSISNYGFVGKSVAAALNPAGALLAVQADDGPGRVVGLRGNGIETVLDIRGSSRQLRFASDGNRLLVLTEAGEISLWDAITQLSPARTTREQKTAENRTGVRAVHFADSRDGWLITGDNRLLVTRDAGETWQRVAGDLVLEGGERANLNDVYFVGRLSGWVAGDGGYLARTADGGGSWTRLETPVAADLYALHFVSNDRGLAVGANGLVLRTDDGGDSWSEIGSGVASELRSVVLLANATGWVAAPGSETSLPLLLQTTDSGASWQAVNYGEYPAPALLFVGLPLLALSLLAVLYRQPQTVQTRGVDPVGASDKPIGWDDPDPLNFKPIAKGLSYFLRNRDTQPPLTIGINGPWGSGKSSLMNLVMEDLRQYGSSPVWFNAWHHQKEEHLLAALLENIRKQAVPRLWQSDGIQFRLRLLWLRIRSEVMLAGGIALAIAGLVLMDELLAGGGLRDAIISFAGAGGKAKEGWQYLHLVDEAGLFGGGAAFFIWILFRLRVLPSDPVSLMASVREGASVRGLRDQLGFRHKFGTEFSEVCRALRSRRSPGLVILVDDLDRCKPQNVLEVLEAVNYLATVGDCFILLGMARRQVENCIAVGFKDFVVEGLKQQEHGLLRIDDLVVAERVDRAKVVKIGNDPGVDASDTPPAEERAESATHATENQRRFARRYLEKLINIEVAVPRGDPGAAAGLFAMSKSEGAPESRMRRRLLAHRILGLAQVAALVVLLGFIGAVVAPILPKGDGDDGSSLDPQGNADTNAIVDPMPAAGDEKKKGGATPVPVQPKTEPTAPGSPLITILPDRPQPVLELRSPWLWLGPPILFCATIVLILLRRRLRPPDLVIEDSNRFTEALQRWYPLIYAVNPTPRAIKRFENRIRYIAMQARPPQQAPDFIDRSLDRLETAWAHIWRKSDDESADDADRDEGKGYRVDDEMLVALGAVEALDARIVREKGVDEVCQLASASTDKLLSQMRPVEPSADDRFVTRLNELRRFFERGKGWPPKPSDLTDFRRLSGQLRG